MCVFIPDIWQVFNSIKYFLHLHRLLMMRGGNEKTYSLHQMTPTTGILTPATTTDLNN